MQRKNPRKIAHYTEKIQYIDKNIKLSKDISSIVDNPEETP